MAHGWVGGGLVVVVELEGRMYACIYIHLKPRRPNTKIYKPNPDPKDSPPSGSKAGPLDCMPCQTMSL